MYFNSVNKSKPLSRAKNSLKQQLQLKLMEWNAAEELFEQQTKRSERLSILPETLMLLRSHKDYLDKTCRDLIKLELRSDELATLANELNEQNIIMLKQKQSANAHRTDASDTETALNTSTASFPNLRERQ